VNVPETIAPTTLPSGFVPVETIEPEAGEVAASFLANPKDKATNRMRKNMKALRVRVFPSRAPIVCTKARPHLGGAPGPMTYAWAANASLSDDLKLEHQLTRRNARQLENKVRRFSVRAALCERIAARRVDPQQQQAFLARAAVLRNIASAAKFELAERRGEVGFENPDGN
jgi:hypothetical protein